MKKLSWKTTIGGLISAAGQALEASTNPTASLVGHILTGIGLILLGASARDSNVTSEQAGAK